MDEVKLLFILGTAAELIKVYPLIHGAQERGWSWQVLSTGQSGQNFWRQYDQFGLSREKSLSLFNSSGDLEHSSQAGHWFLKALFKSPHSLAQLKAPWVVVHGDTLSTLIGALWAKRLKWPVAHVEAGLRSDHWWQPFPEEICRRFVSRLTRLHFAPDQVALENVSRYNGLAVNTKGNTLLDAVHLCPAQPFMPRQRPLCVVNLHRYENLNSPSRWAVLMETTLKAAKRFEVCFVMHPQTEHKIRQSPEDEKRLVSSGVHLVPRMMFGEFMAMIKEAECLISDGGSNQEETYYLGIPCLLLRETTERREGLGSTAVLSRFNTPVIDQFLQQPQQFRRAPLQLQESPTEIILNTLKAQMR